ncbi:MAG: hypothetical protein ABI977_30100 [Acidobacteriota bacterium]
MKKLDDKEVVTAFVAYLRENGNQGLVVDSRPDSDNRKSSDIDAIAGKFAIEHTSVDSVENQRRDGVWFVRVAEPLESQFKEVLSFKLILKFPYDGIAKGQDWEAVRRSLETWISNEAGKLSDGSHQINISAVPFNFLAIKNSKVNPGLFFHRDSPRDTGQASWLSSQLSRKVAKLQRYNAMGKTTILLVESDDIPLMNDYKMLELIKSVFGSGMPEHIDQVWYVDTSLQPDLEFWDFTQELIDASQH